MPFSIAPDPELLFLSAAHSDALAHLNYSLTAHGGLICLTGEVGLGKTTLCRAFISSLPDNIKVAYIFNPQLSPIELLHALCQELGFDDSSQSLQSLTNTLYHGLLELYQQGKKVLCIIDEAQTMPAPLLEQIRLLTNLETDKEKLMTLILVGQPELREMLSQHNLRQLSQRITARYHLSELDLAETEAYLKHRLQIAGCSDGIFEPQAIKQLWQLSNGVPRLINVIADRALLGAYANSQQTVNVQTIKQAASEVLGDYTSKSPSVRLASASIDNPTNTLFYLYPIALIIVLAAFLYVVLSPSLMTSNSEPRLASEVAVVVEQRNESKEKDLEQFIAPEKALIEKLQLPAENCQQLTTIGWQCLYVDWPYSFLESLNQDIKIKSKTTGLWQPLDSVYPNDYANEALLLWQPIAGFTDAIHPFENHTAVGWVRSHFPSDKLDTSQWKVIGSDGEAKISEYVVNFYDAQLADKVAKFQARYGLKSDRIIGPQTLMMLKHLQENNYQQNRQSLDGASSTSVGEQ